MHGSICREKADGLEPNKRIGPRHPRLGAAGIRAAQWLGTRAMEWAGFHPLRSAISPARIAGVREKLARGETVYLAGLAPPGTHNSGVALVEVTQVHGPRLIVNNEEERFSGNKHTTEYPRRWIEAMAATLRGMGRGIDDIDAWLTSWDYPTLAGTIARSVLEEVPQSLKLLRTTEAAGFDGRRLDQMTRTPKILAKQLGLSERIQLICLPHPDVFRPRRAGRHRRARRHRRSGIHLALCHRKRRHARPLLQRQHVRFTR